VKRNYFEQSLGCLFPDISVDTEELRFVLNLTALSDERVVTGWKPLDVTLHNLLPQLHATFCPALLRFESSFMGSVDRRRLSRVNGGSWVLQKEIRSIE
jgi:hypothetical protein